MSIHTYIGIDPGHEGAIAAISNSNPDLPWIVDMPLLKAGKSKTRTRVDAASLKIILQSVCSKASRIWLEHLWGFGTSVAGCNELGQFSFADDYGMVRGLLIGLDLDWHLVTPQKWQKSVEKKPGKKEGSIWRALELFPNAPLMRPRAKTYCDGRAEALLIAYYGWSQSRG